MEPDSIRAKRLGYVLKRYSENSDSVQKIATALNHIPGGLLKDMKAVIDYIEEMEEKVNRTNL